MESVKKFPFGQILQRLQQEDRNEKEVFVLGVYSSAVHAKWIGKDGKPKCRALAVASEPRIFWDGNQEEAKAIISKISIPTELGTLQPADEQYNGPSGKSLDEHILAPLGFSRKDAWLCDLLPEARLNVSQFAAIEKHYNPEIVRFGLSAVSLPCVPKEFCDEKRVEEITQEILSSNAKKLVLLGDVPIKQFLKKVSNVDFPSLDAFDKKHGYGNSVMVSIAGINIEVLPLAHPRQISKLGSSSKKWYDKHSKWEKSLRK